jgi:glycerol-3-phosphate dehydrogenase subunit B
VSRRVLVAGAGIAGLAAAFRARALGCDVTVVSDRPGASALGGGAVDDLPWEQLVRAARTLGIAPEPRLLAPQVAEFTRALGIWDLPEKSLVWIATAAGRIRPARGRDRALLDLGPLEGREVLLPRADRADWDADALAAGLSDDSFARSRRTRFIAVDLPILRFDEEHRIPDGDLASRHDDEMRLGWLAARLRDGLGRRRQAGAVLLGPWLGSVAPRAQALSKAIGVPVGEVLAGAGSPAGLRFEAARDRLLGEIGARLVRDRVLSCDVDAGRAEVSLARGEAPVIVDAVVLAIGGLVSGGVMYAPPEHEASADLPPGGRMPFALSLRADVVLAGQSVSSLSSLAPRETGVTSSLHGPELDLTAWPSDGRQGVLEAAGVCCDGVRAAPGVTAAGDVIAGRPRTVLEAVLSGLRAGNASARVSAEG